MVDKEKGEKGSGTAPVEKEGETDEMDRYRQILARDPSSLVFAALAEAYRKRKRLNQAIETCKKGLRVHPHFLSGRVALARAYADADKMDLARKELERVVLSASDNLVAQRLLGDIYRKTVDLDRLEKTLHRILALDTEDERAREELQWIHIQKGIHPSATGGNSLKRDIITKTLAEIYASQGFHEQAFKIYQKLSWEKPDNPLFHERLADLKERVMQRSGRTKGRTEASTSEAERPS